MEPAALVKLPHFPKEWQLIMDDPLPKLNPTWSRRRKSTEKVFPESALHFRKLEESRAGSVITGREDMLKINAARRLGEVVLLRGTLSGLWCGVHAWDFQLRLLSTYASSFHLFPAEHHSRGILPFSSIPSSPLNHNLQLLTRLGQGSPESERCCGQHEILHSPRMHSHSREGNNQEVHRQSVMRCRSYVTRLALHISGNYSFTSKHAHRFGPLTLQSWHWPWKDV